VATRLHWLADTDKRGAQAMSERASEADIQAVMHDVTSDSVAVTSTVLRRQRLVRHLHRLGERALDELLVEVGNAHDINDDVLARLERYGRLSPAVVRALGAAELQEREFLVLDRETS
jgi:hypothetical protein